MNIRRACGRWNIRRRHRLDVRWRTIDHVGRPRNVRLLRLLESHASQRCNNAARYARCSSFRAIPTYASTAACSSAMSTNSSAVCAVWIDPGPKSSG